MQHTADPVASQRLRAFAFSVNQARVEQALITILCRMSSRFRCHFGSTLVIKLFASGRVKMLAE